MIPATIWPRTQDLWLVAAAYATSARLSSRAKSEWFYINPVGSRERAVARNRARDWTAWYGGIDAGTFYLRVGDITDFAASGFLQRWQVPCSSELNVRAFYIGFPVTYMIYAFRCCYAYPCLVFPCIASQSFLFPICHQSFLCPIWPTYFAVARLSLIMSLHDLHVFAEQCTGGAAKPI